MRKLFKYLFAFIASFLGISKANSKEIAFQVKDCKISEWKGIEIKPQQGILSPKDYGILLSKGGKHANRLRK